MLNELFGIQGRVVSKISLNFKRDLNKTINWERRMIIITGARGTGKTTLVLQHYLETYNDLKKCLYISADNPLVLRAGIYNTAAILFFSISLKTNISTYYQMSLTKLSTRTSRP